MDYAPLNLAHFHERRADKFLKKHRYDDAHKAIQTSLIYLQDALKTVEVDKSIDLIETQKWDYERKLRQILMQKQQYERLKLKEIVPIPESNMLKASEIHLSGHSLAKSIDKTVEKFDFKSVGGLVNLRKSKFCDKSGSELLSKYMPIETHELALSDATNFGAIVTDTALALHQHRTMPSRNYSHPIIEELDDLPSLDPLELPSFDMSMCTASSFIWENIENYK